MSEPMTATIPQAAPPVPVPPQTIGRFTVLNEIGRGSYGVVYCGARSRSSAARSRSRSSRWRARSGTAHQIEASFLREAKSAGGMSHPGIVTIYDADKTDALAYIAMERLHGQDLHEYLASGNRMNPRQAAAMMMRVADAIHYANKRGLVHRDIKPSNIFLSRDLKPKLLDFGTALAPVAEPMPKGTRQLVGTPNYMSPEQARGESLDARSDIFSLGTILYELLAGRRAFDGRTVDETLDRVMDAGPKPVEKIRPDTPPALAQIVRKAMSPNPADRYQKASELRNALAEFVDGSRPASVDSTARPCQRGPRRRSTPSRGPLLLRRRVARAAGRRRRRVVHAATRAGTSRARNGHAGSDHPADDATGRRQSTLRRRRPRRTVRTRRRRKARPPRASGPIRSRSATAR